MSAQYSAIFSRGLFSVCVVCSLDDNKVAEVVRIEFGGSTFCSNTGRCSCDTQATIRWRSLSRMMSKPLIQKTTKSLRNWSIKTQLTLCKLWKLQKSTNLSRFLLRSRRPALLITCSIKVMVTTRMSPFLNLVVFSHGMWTPLQYRKFPSVSSNAQLRGSVIQSGIFQSRSYQKLVPRSWERYFCS